MLHPPAAVALAFVVMNFTVGLVLATTFQLAHCVEEVEFPQPMDDVGHMSADRAEHQLATTVDFSRNSCTLTWLMLRRNRRALPRSAAPARRTRP